MKVITRTKAIKMIYALSNELGFDYERLHSLLTDWGFGSDPHISTMLPIQIRDVLVNLLNIKGIKAHYFVKEYKWVIYIKLEAKRCGVSIKHLNNLIRKRFKKESIYKLTKDERRGLIKVLRYYKNKQEKEMKIILNKKEAKDGNKS